MAEIQDRPLVFVKLHAEQKSGTKGPKAPKGEPLDISDKILSFKFDDEERKADRFEITLDNHDLSEFDSPVWKQGGVLEVTWGYPGQMSPARFGVIEKLSGGRELRVEARGLEMLLHRAKTTKVYQGKTLFQLVEEVSKKYADVLSGFAAADAEKTKDLSSTSTISTSAKEIKLAFAAQSAETDAQLVSKYAHKYGYVFYIDHQGVHFKPRDEVYKQKPAKVLTWFNSEGEWLDFNYHSDSGDKSTKVTEKGVDPLNKKKIETVAGNEETQRAGLAPRVRDLNTMTGEQVLTDRTPASYVAAQNKAEEAKSKSGGLFDSLSDKLSKLGQAESTDVSHFSGTSPQQAKAKADGKYKRRQRHKHELSGTVVGDPKFQAKTVLEVVGLGLRLSGRWAVRKVSHKIDSSGYTCDFEADRDGDHGFGHKGDHNSKAKIPKDEVKKDADGPIPLRKIDQRTGEFVMTTFNPEGRTK